MKRILLFFIIVFIGINHADATVRTENSIARNTSNTQTLNNAIASRSATPTISSPARNLVSSTTSRNSTNIVNRTNTSTTARTANTTNTNTIPTTNARSATTINRSTTNTTTTARSATNTNVVRSTSIPRTSITQSEKTARNAVRAAVVSTATNTFGTGYNACRDAYFTCMDQFCATANETYRRCICSSRLSEIQEKERALSQTSDQLQDFKDLNIEVINKTAQEVNAMITASEGEQAIKEDKSDSAKALSGISDVLAANKAQSLSTLGKLDIAGDINQIWATTDLTSGENIANLTGESLYNAVHKQCVDLVADSCESSAILNMVVSAYGMYIENDCTTLSNSLQSQKNQASSTIRETEREMNLARLENYNAHNSTEINDCIAQVRKDITAETACGEDYIHCLDITGLYLNRDTGEPIYSESFYQLQNMTSLDGDVLTNSANRLLVAELNRKRIYAERGLDTCQDIADEVWDEFMRQAIAEIYQGQQDKIRQVKEECLEVVNNCYDTQSEQLKDFSNIREELLLGSRLELSEEMCQEKLYACSNLYGDPNGEGLELLIAEMNNITDQKIAQQCKSLLESFAKDMCKVSNNDSLHNYPYGCRVYAPGEQKYATNWACNQLKGTSSETYDNSITPSGSYLCSDSRRYTYCNTGYYLARYKNGTWVYDNNTTLPGNFCQICPVGATCSGGTSAPQLQTDQSNVDCGTTYPGSLYQKMVKYATQVCVRPSDLDAITTGDKDIPTNVLADVNSVMDSIKAQMSKELSAECERIGGTWIDFPWIDIDPLDGAHDVTGYTILKNFYDETGSDKNWGYCANKQSISTLSN